MPRITIHLGGRERLEARISKATPLGALGTEALVYLGTTCLSGRAMAMRALADDYDTDPEAFNEREQAERATDH
jgi:hypothetical protein